MSDPYTLRLGGILGGKKLNIYREGAGHVLTYSSVYGTGFTVRTADIETATVDVSGFGKGTLRIIGRGTTLAEVTLPRTWAEKARAFVLEHMELP